MNHHEIDRMVKEMTPEDQKEWTKEAMRNWRSWGSWFSWGSPVGLGLFLVAIGVFMLLLHSAGLLR